MCLHLIQVLELDGWNCFRALTIYELHTSIDTKLNCLGVKTNIRIDWMKNHWQPKLVYKAVVEACTSHWSLWNTCTVLFEVMVPFCCLQQGTMNMLVAITYLQIDVSSSFLIFPLHVSNHPTSAPTPANSLAKAAFVVELHICKRLALSVQVGLKIEHLTPHIYSFAELDWRNHLLLKGDRMTSYRCLPVYFKGIKFSG